MREHPEEYFLLISDELKAAYQVGSLPLSPKNDSIAMSCVFISRTCTSIKGSVGCSSAMKQKYHNRVTAGRNVKWLSVIMSTPEGMPAARLGLCQASCNQRFLGVNWLTGGNGRLCNPRWLGYMQSVSSALQAELKQADECKAWIAAMPAETDSEDETQKLETCFRCTSSIDPSLNGSVSCFLPSQDHCHFTHTPRTLLFPNSTCRMSLHMPCPWARVMRFYVM